MTPRAADPAAMTAAERLAEIARICAESYLRLQISRVRARQGLDDCRPVEAQCGSHALNPKSTESKK